eukprot:scaffold8878_cov27-Tisochrysis_lutea.AAC.5
MRPPWPAAAREGAEATVLTSQPPRRAASVMRPARCGSLDAPSPVCSAERIDRLSIACSASRVWPMPIAPEATSATCLPARWCWLWGERVSAGATGVAEPEGGGEPGGVNGQPLVPERDSWQREHRARGDALCEGRVERRCSERWRLSRAVGAAAGAGSCRRARAERAERVGVWCGGIILAWVDLRGRALQSALRAMQGGRVRESRRLW